MHEPKEGYLVLAQLDRTGLGGKALRRVGEG